MICTIWVPTANYGAKTKEGNPSFAGSIPFPYITQIELN